MKTYLTRTFIVTLAVGLAVSACNLPFAVPSAPPGEPALDEQDIALTAAALVLAAQPTATTDPAAAAPAGDVACEATVTATVNANVRNGPGTDYTVVGSLPQSASAPVAGQSADGTWWYIAFAGGPSGYGWIAASVTTPSCIPVGLAVIPAPPPPPTQEVAAQPEGGDDDGQVFQINPGIFQAFKADLVITQFSISPQTPVMGQNTTATIGVKNQGLLDAGTYNVRWYGLSTFSNPSCSWNPSTPAGESDTLICNFVFQSWYPINKISLAIVDYNNVINETNEDNNEATISPFGVVQ